jgi:predicted Zn-dependent protease
LKFRRRVTVDMTHAEPGTSQAAVLRLEFAGPTRRTTAAVASMWCSGWLLIACAALLQTMRLGRFDFYLIAGTFLWITAGVPVLAALLWTALGRREILSVANGRFTIVRPLGPFKWTHAFDAAEIRGFRATYALRPLLADGAAIRDFWLGGAGPIVFEHRRRRFACGIALDTKGATKAAADLAAAMPMASLTEPTVTPPARLRPWAIAYVAAATIVPAFAVPYKLAVTDRAICFCQDPAPPPANPVNLSTVATGGRVVFVPVDGYSTERAQMLAEHFRRTFAIPVRVDRSIATSLGAFDRRRGQMNASALLTALEERYREGSRAVVIGLTDADMFIPDANRSYALSYRRENRIAIVSSARMDRGCLGLLAASDERRLARMRKIIGKNIGVMYYRLPVSRDPRSMLFATIAGPQELDRMSESY